MKGTVSSILALAAMLAGLSCAEADDTKPAIGLRQFTLGMPLEEFRKLPVPESTNPSFGPVKARTVKLFCNGDKAPESVLADPSLRSAPDIKRIGAIRCSHFYKSSGNPMWSINAMKVGDADALVEFLFTPKTDPAGSRLGMVLARTGSDEFSGLERALIAKYGQPSTQDNSDARNALGGAFDNTVDTWDVGEAAITLVKRDGHPNNTSLTYSSKPLMAEIQALLDEQAKAAGSSL